VLVAAARALCSLLTNVTHTFDKLGENLTMWFKFCVNQARGLNQQKKRSTMRALYALGVIVKYVDISQISTLAFSQNTPPPESLYNMILMFNRLDDEIRETAFEALSMIWIRFPDLLYKSEDIIAYTLSQPMDIFSKIKILAAFKEFLISLNEMMTQYTETDIGNMLSILDKFMEQLVSLALDAD
jgi:hypothetical protein